MSDEPVRSLAAEFGPTVATTHSRRVKSLGARAIFLTPGQVRAAVAEYEANQARVREWIRAFQEGRGWP